MDDPGKSDGYGSFQESYGVVPSNSEYHPSLRSVIASAPPVLESESLYDTFTPNNLFELRKQKRKVINESADPIEIRVRKLNQNVAFPQRSPPTATQPQVNFSIKACI